MFHQILYMPIIDQNIYFYSSRHHFYIDPFYSGELITTQSFLQQPSPRSLRKTAPYLLRLTQFKVFRCDHVIRFPHMYTYTYEVMNLTLFIKEEETFFQKLVFPRTMHFLKKCFMKRKSMAIKNLVPWPLMASQLCVHNFSQLMLACTRGKQQLTKKNS